MDSPENDRQRRKRLWKYARRMRDQMTAGEAALWNVLKDGNLGTWWAQRPLINWRYIADFYQPDMNLVVEVDGGYHLDPVQEQRDQVREASMKDHGLSILRFTNEQAITETQTCKRRIVRRLRAIQAFRLGHERKAGKWKRRLDKRGPGFHSHL